MTKDDENVNENIEKDDLIALKQKYQLMRSISQIKQKLMDSQSLKSPQSSKSSPNTSKIKAFHVNSTINAANSSEINNITNQMIISSESPLKEFVLSNRKREQPASKAAGFGIKKAEGFQMNSKIQEILVADHNRKQDVLLLENINATGTIRETEMEDQHSKMYSPANKSLFAASAIRYDYSGIFNLKEEYIFVFSGYSKGGLVNSVEVFDVQRELWHLFGDAD